jgi:hypothetical protein
LHPSADHSNVLEREPFVVISQVRHTQAQHHVDVVAGRQQPLLYPANTKASI